MKNVLNGADPLLEYESFVDYVAKKFISDNNISPDYFLEEVSKPDSSEYIELAIQLDRWGITVGECNDLYKKEEFPIAIGWDWRIDFYGENLDIDSGNLPEFQLYISKDSISLLENKYPKLAEGERRCSLIESFMENMSVLEFELRKRQKYSIYAPSEMYEDIYLILMDGLSRWREQEGFPEGRRNSLTFIPNLDLKEEFMKGLTPRTHKATDARVRKTEERWKELSPLMVRIYARMEKGRQYQKKEVAELFKAEGVELNVGKSGRITDARLDYFWQTFTNSGRPISDLTKCGLADANAATSTDIARQR